MSPQTPALRNTAIALALSILCCAQAPMPEPVTDQETELGDQMYKELKAKGEIVASSPLYDTLKPIADSISRAAQSRYPHPFKFFIVHEPQPNAFATPGGNVYVVDSLFYFVKNTEQLAGTLCHEVSHTIHRDGVALMEKRNRIKRHSDRHAPTSSPSLCSDTSIRSDIRARPSRTPTSRARISAPKLVTIRGAWCGCSRSFRTRRRYTFPPCFPTILPTEIEWQLSKNTCAITPPFSANSILTRRRPPLWLFRRTPPSNFCRPILTE
jgi:Peptidase family M48